jgi:DNA-binding beta-propeller fold protein YncE
VVDGSRRRVIGSKGSEPLRFKCPRQVWIASDDFVFVADCYSNRVQVLTPRLDFHCFIGVGELHRPAGVCANDSVVVVSEIDANRISVFNRSGDGTLLRRFGSYGHGDGHLQFPQGLCFMASNSYVAVADCCNSRVSVFSVDGDFIRHVGVGKLSSPYSAACSAFDELVVTDYKCVTVFSGSGELLKKMGRGEFRGIAIHGGTVFAQHYSDAKCIIFK